jgi:hypothetical protein
MNQLITCDEFTKRIVKLLVRSNLTDLPKSALDQQVLFKSVMLYLGQTDKMSEKEVNAKLIAWIQDVARMQAFDHVTLRRALVDAGYLTRSSDGATYQISPFNPRAWQFEAAIEHLDVLDVLNTAREEMAQRKRAYLEKAQKQKRG